MRVGSDADGFVSAAREGLGCPAFRQEGNEKGKSASACARLRVGGNLHAEGPPAGRRVDRARAYLRPSDRAAR